MESEKGVEQSHIQFAVSFARTVVESDYEKACAMLSPSLQETTSATKLRQAYKNMISYADNEECEPPDVEPILLFGEESQETGYVYVAISNNCFCEAVYVFVARERGQYVINFLDWGRP